MDVNRNYGAFWGGPGASGDVSDETYYGPGPFSEPESQNIRDLISGRQVTTLITNQGDLPQISLTAYSPSNANPCP